MRELRTQLRIATARPALMTTILTGLLAVPTVASAGVVSGKVELPAPPARPAAAPQGYLARTANPYLPPLDVDPTPYMVVVLTGGPVGEARSPAEVVWELRGDSFAQPLLPVKAGTTVVLRNASRQPATLSTVEDPGALKNAVINPPSSKAFKAPAAGSLVNVVDADRPHVRGAVLGLDTPFFVVPSATGAFEIPDVPAGKWTVRIWYRTGWLDRVDDSITVGTSKLDVKPKVPTGFPIKGAAATGAAAGK